MSKKTILILVILLLFFGFLFSQTPQNKTSASSPKKIFLYFMGEEAGYEEYEWLEQTDRYILSARGEMRKPISLIVEQMTLELDKEFKPLRFYLKGEVRGIVQEIETTISQGEVKNKILAGDQKRETTANISPDALILPNGIFAPYVILAKRAMRLGQEKATFRAYVIPQLEVSASVEPDMANPLFFHLNLAGVKIELLTDKEGFLKSISIPSQGMEALERKLEKDEPAEVEKGTGYALFVQGREVGKGYYSLEKKDNEILIKGKTRQALNQLSIDFQFEEKLSLDWNFKESFLKGKANDKQVEFRAEVIGDHIKTILREGERIFEKQFPYSSDILFRTENPLLDNLLVIKKISGQDKKKFYFLSKAWASPYLEEPLLMPVNVKNEGAEILMEKEREIRTQKFFVDIAGANGGFVWAENGEVLKISFPFAAMDVFHQDCPGLMTKEILSPEMTSDKYISEEVTFPSGEIKLAATLTIPKNEQEKRPAVVLISGSGPQDRNEDTIGPGGLKFGIFKQIAHYLSEDGISVLRYDDRGTGLSEGNFIEAAQEDLIEDVKAAVAYLRTRDDIFSHRIALVGHSEGAIIAPRVAAEDPNLAAIVLLAGTAETGDKVLRQQFNFVLDGMELSGEGREEALANYEKTLKIIKGEPVDKEFEEKVKPQLELQLKWLRSFINYDPLSVLDQIRCPVLIINGGKDKQVFPHHARMIHKRLKELNIPVSLKIYPDLNHLLIPSEIGAYGEYAKQAMEEKRLSQEFLIDLTGWLCGVFFAKSLK